MSADPDARDARALREPTLDRFRSVRRRARADLEWNQGRTRMWGVTTERTMQSCSDSSSTTATHRPTAAPPSPPGTDSRAPCADVHRLDVHLRSTRDLVDR